LLVLRLTSALAALAFAAVAAGCATPQASNEPAAAKPAETSSASLKADSDDYITGSRLPRKNSQNTQGTVKASPDEYKRYEPPQGRSVQ
jgi:hypothetical protein